MNVPEFSQNNIDDLVVKAIAMSSFLNEEQQCEQLPVKRMLNIPSAALFNTLVSVGSVVVYLSSDPTINGGCWYGMGGCFTS